jgi:hypothetical protein
MDSQFRNQEWEKKYDEFRWIRPLINNWSNDIIGLCITEEPDFHLHFQNKTIGLEFTKLINGKEQSEFNEFKKVLNEYAIKEFDEMKKNDKRFEDSSYRIKVWFNEGFKPYIPDSSRVSKHKKELFNELNQWIFRFDSLNKPFEYIIRVETEPCQSLEHSEIKICYINPIQLIPLELIQKAIRKKEKKLDNYQKLPRNKDITEYWLAIGLPEQYDIHSIDLSVGIKSNFNRIYVLQNVYVKQLNVCHD